MQERRYDGTDHLTDNATQEDLAKALEDKMNQMVALHKPGSLIQRADGRQYQVQHDGSWKRITDHSEGE